MINGLSIPTAVGLNGVGERVLPALNEQELQALRHSADVLKQGLAGIKL